MDKSLYETEIKKIKDQIKKIYLEDEIPWVVGYSGGKDSTAVTQLVWESLEELEPEKPIAGDAFERRHNIPKYLPDALKRLKVSNELAEILGNDFLTLYTEIKQTEHDAYQNVISAWEREHLLLNV